MNKEDVYIIIPVHNRKEITLKCLDTLRQNGDLDKYHVVVVDDGSTDGTSEAIKSLYPDIIILTGDGNLWWTGAIAMGMKHAYERGAEYFIWLNDDCYPQQGTISKLIISCQSNQNSIVGAQSIDPQTGESICGGIIIQKNHIIGVNALKSSPVECDGLDGHLVCIHRRIIDEIGYPNYILFPHYCGDHIYTNCAKRKGYKLLILGDAIAFSKNDHSEISWLNPDRPILSYWQDYFKIKSPSYWKTNIYYYYLMFGIFGIPIYLYRYIIRFWLFFIFVKITPLSFRKFLVRTKK